MVELYEENIEEWYKTQRDNVSLTEYLCERSGILKTNEKECLYEKFDETKKENAETGNEKSVPQNIKSEDAHKIRNEIERQSKKGNPEL